MAPPKIEGSDKNPMSVDWRAGCTARQGQFLAFIEAYTLVNGRPPAEADMQRFFQLTGAIVHQMVLTLERDGWISRQPGIPRSIRRRIGAAQLPERRPAYHQPVKSTVQRWFSAFSCCRPSIAAAAHPVIRTASGTNARTSPITPSVTDTRKPGRAFSSRSAAPCSSATAATRLRPRPLPRVVRLWSSR